MNEAQQYSINPVFAGHLANQLREDTDDLQRVFDNLLEIAKGSDPTANTHDRLRATRILYDRGFGKVSKNTPQAPAPRSSRPPKSEESHNHTNHSSDNPRPEPAKAPKPKPAASNRPSTTPTTPPKTPTGRSGTQPTSTLTNPIRARPEPKSTT